jgi:hypothetical protein
MEPDEAPEPEPESQNWQEPPMGRFFTELELGDIYLSCQTWDYEKED